MGEVETGAGGLSPTKVFLALAALLTAGIATYFLTQDTTTDPTQSIDQPPAQSIPTEAEAIQLVRDLQGLSYDAYENRDLALVSEFALEGSAYAEDVTSEIERMLADGAKVLIVKKRIPLEVVSISSTEIVVEGRFYSDASIVDEQGKKISRPHEPEIQDLMWTLAKTASGWRIQEVRITKVREA